MSRSTRGGGGRWRGNLARSLTFLVLPTVYGCKGMDDPAPQPAYHFAFVTNNSSEFWNIAAKGVLKAEKDFGIKVDVFRPLKGQVSEQERYLDDIVVLNFDGIAINPVSPDTMTPAINRVAEKMPVICHDSDAPRSQRRTYVGSDNVEAGRAAASAALRALGRDPTGKVAVFVGRDDMQNAIQRQQGLFDVLKGESLEILPVFLDNSDRARGKNNAEDALARYPDLVLMVGLWSYEGPALAAAARESSRSQRPVIVAFDEDEETLQAIDSGLIDATIVQKPFEFGYQSMRLLKDAKDGKVVPEVLDTGFTTVRKDNLTDFLTQFPELEKRTTGDK